jgi:hypothetical protein
MRFRSVRTALRPIVLFLLLISGCSFGLAQEPEKPNAPEPAQGPVKQNLKVISAQAPYRMISGKERIQWAARETFGPQSFLLGTLTAGIGTARDHPEEYGPHWDGFAQRYGMRLTGVATSSTIEAGLGSIWGEDPRYVLAEGQGFGHRVGHVVKLAFAARNREGELRPAYARYIAIPAGNFLSNTWRADSASHNSDALRRSGYGVLSRLAGNAWSEFWPDVKQKVFKK